MTDSIPFYYYLIFAIFALFALNGVMLVLRTVVFPIICTVLDTFSTPSKACPNCGCTRIKAYCAKCGQEQTGLIGNNYAPPRGKPLSSPPPPPKKLEPDQIAAYRRHFINDIDNSPSIPPPPENHFRYQKGGGKSLRYHIK